MGIRAPKTVREQRARALEPLFAHMRLQRMSNRWMAQQLGIPEKRLWAYKSGEIRIPEWFIECACQIIGIPPARIRIPNPRALYIQQPRSASTPSASTTATKQSAKKRTATR